MDTLVISKSRFSSSCAKMGRKTLLTEKNGGGCQQRSEIIQQAISEAWRVERHAPSTAAQYTDMKRERRPLLSQPRMPLAARCLEAGGHPRRSSRHPANFLPQPDIHGQLCTPLVVYFPVWWVDGGLCAWPTTANVQYENFLVTSNWKLPMAVLNVFEYWLPIFDWSLIFRSLNAWNNFTTFRLHRKWAVYVCQSVRPLVCLSRGSTRLHCVGVIRYSLCQIFFSSRFSACCNI